MQFGIPFGQYESSDVILGRISGLEADIYAALDEFRRKFA